MFFFLFFQFLMKKPVFSFFKKNRNNHQHWTEWIGGFCFSLRVHVESEIFTNNICVIQTDDLRNNEKHEICIYDITPYIHKITANMYGSLPILFFLRSKQRLLFDVFF